MKTDTQKKALLRGGLTTAWRQKMDEECQLGPWNRPGPKVPAERCPGTWAWGGSGRRLQVLAGEVLAGCTVTPRIGQPGSLALRATKDATGQLFSPGVTLVAHSPGRVNLRN